MISFLRKNKRKFYGISIISFILLYETSVVNSRELFSCGKYGAVSTGHELASSVALKVLAEGGNAVDAAVAAAFMLGVVEPSNSGLGGEGFALLHIPRKGFEAWDASIIPPPSMATITSNIGMPTEPAFLLSLLERHGTFTRSRILQPAIETASNGFPISPYLAALLQERLPHFRDERLLRVFAPDARPPIAGEIIKQPALANTLQVLSSLGLNALCDKNFGYIIANDIIRRGSSYTVDYISSFRPRISKPSVIKFGDFTILGCRPPSASIVVMSALKAIYDLEQRQNTRASFEQKLDIIAIAFDLFANYMPHSVNSPARFFAEAQLKFKELENANLTAPTTVVAPMGDTTHLVTWDANGMIVSMTLTLGKHFGTGDFSPLGFFYNDETANRKNKALKYPPDYPASFGPVTTKSPLIVLENGKPIFAIGGAGGGRIISNLILVVDALLHKEKSIVEAVHAPRIEMAKNGEIAIEWSPNQRTSVGKALIKVKPAGTDIFGLVSVVGFASDTFTAAADYRRDGSCAALSTNPSDKPKESFKK